MDTLWDVNDYLGDLAAMLDAKAEWAQQRAVAAAEHQANAVAVAESRGG